jgi:hypothetical protein
MRIRAKVIGHDRIARKFGNHAGRALMWHREMELETEGLIRPAAAAHSPVFTGDLAGSWQGEAFSTGFAFGGTVGSPLVYAAPVEKGRSAGSPLPPPGAIDSWVQSRIGGGASAFVIGRAIAERGIEPKAPLKQAIDETLPARLALRDQLLRRLVKDS